MVWCERNTFCCSKLSHSSHFLFLKRPNDNNSNKSVNTPSHIMVKYLLATPSLLEAASTGNDGHNRNADVPNTTKQWVLVEIGQTLSMAIAVLPEQASRRRLPYFFWSSSPPPLPGQCRPSLNCLIAPQLFHRTLWIALLHWYCYLCHHNGGERVGVILFLQVLPLLSSWAPLTKAMTVRVVPPLHGRTQRRIYDLFLLEALRFVCLLYDREWRTTIFVRLWLRHAHTKTHHNGRHQPRPLPLSVAVHCLFRRNAYARYVVADVGHARSIFFAWRGWVLWWRPPPLLPPPIAVCGPTRHNMRARHIMGNAGHTQFS